jgi:hypothetical protein
VTSRQIRYAAVQREAKFSRLNMPGFEICGIEAEAAAAPHGEEALLRRLEP